MSGARAFRFAVLVESPHGDRYRVQLAAMTRDKARSGAVHEAWARNGKLGDKQAWKAVDIVSGWRNEYWHANAELYQV